MSTLRIERIPIKKFGLGFLGGDHIQLVLQQNDFDPRPIQDNWYVMEGLRETGPIGNMLGVEGWDGHTTLSHANDDKVGQALIDEIGTPWGRGSRYLLQGPAGGLAWQTMQSYAEDYASQEFPYFAYKLPFGPVPVINSTSLVGSLLYYAGIDISVNFPFGLRLSPGWDTLLGSQGDDELGITNSLQNIFGGEGDDTLTSADGIVQLDRLYGGYGADTLYWSHGNNIFHGGQPLLGYVQDGIDTVNYSGAGVIHIEMNSQPIPSLRPDFVVTTAFGEDELYSIEKLEWDEASDQIDIGPGVHILDDLELKLGPQSSTGQGDKVSLAEVTEKLLINASDGELISIRVEGSSNDEGSIWLEGAEWLVGSAANDRIYAGAHMRGVEGGAGDDLIDARLLPAFGEQSPRGFDIEIDGGEGSDTIVSGAGRTSAAGGGDADRFVLSATTVAGEPLSEFVIEDGDGADRVYVPYDFFNLTDGDFEGSSLMALRGAIAQIPGHASFFDLPQNVGPWTMVTEEARVDFFGFQWQTNDQSAYGSNSTHGVIDFTGGILYNRDGADLLIHVFLGSPLDVVDEGSNELPWNHTVNVYFPNTETIIRVKNFQEGDLGINFYDPGEPETVEISTDHGNYSSYVYPFLDSAVHALTNDFMGPLDARPDSLHYDPDKNENNPNGSEKLIGSSGDDTIVDTSNNRVVVDGAAGNDYIQTGNAGDFIDGGRGADQMSGGGGGDTYIVDNVNDVIIESSNGGDDKVISSVDFTLSAFAERLTLADSALTGNGNDAANTITGTYANNTLRGFGGDDILAGSFGDDLLDGGNGSDRYYYDIGHGFDVIVDAGPETDTDTLVFSGINSSDVTVHRRLSAPGDLILSIAQGGRVALEGWMSAPGAGIDVVVFQDHVTWSRADLEAFAASASILDNDAPQAADDPYTLVAGNDVSIAAEAFLENDRDPDGDVLSIVSVSDVTPGAFVSVTADGNIRLVTPTGFDGIVDYTYQISDGHGGFDTAMAEVSVLHNSAPVAAAPIPDQVSPQNTAWTFVLPANLFNDPEGDAVYLSASLAGGGALPGWLSFNPATGTFTGTPPAALTGDVDLVVTATDGIAASSAGFTLTLEPENANTAPVAADDSGFDVVAGHSLIIAAADLLANDNDADGDTLTITAVSGASHGTVMLDGAGNVVFTANAGYSGAAAFNYNIADANGGSASASVALDVLAAPPPPGRTIVGTNGDDQLRGTRYADIIVGKGGDDILNGLAGNDVFVVKGQNNGFDIFHGGAGTDRIEGGTANDVIGVADVAGALSGIEVIDGGDGYDVLRLTSVSAASSLAGLLGGGAVASDGNDNLNLSAITVVSIELIDAGSGNDTVIGSAGNDHIAGAAGNDRLYGGAGDDRLVGGAGLDLLKGGAGSDTFVFSGNFGQDAIADFAVGTAAQPLQDVIELHGTGLNSFAQVMSHATQSGGSVVITFDADTSLRLAHVRLGDLKADDFHFF